jgi:adenosine deaminase
VAVTVNTDNPRVSDVTLSQEHALARYATGLADEQLRLVARQSATAAFSDLSFPEA